MANIAFISNGVKRTIQFLARPMVKDVLKMDEDEIELLHKLTYKMLHNLMEDSKNESN